MRWILAVLVCLLTGCGHPVYTLARQGRTAILTPPPTKPELRNARESKKTGCDVAAGPFSIEWRGKTAHLAANTEEYYAPPEQPVQQPKPPGIAIAEGGPRMYADSLADLEKFRDAVAGSDCLGSKEISRLEQGMTESFPFPPQIAAYLRFGTYSKTGFIDLTPGFLLRVASPAADGGPDLSLYSANGNDKVRIALVSGAGRALTIPETEAFYRYLYWTGASAHNFRATVLGADNRSALREATRQFLDDPEAYCAKPAAGIFCQSIAVSAGMNAGFYIKVNGRDVFARVGGSVGEAIGDPTGRSRAIPHVTSLRRMYHGKLIPVLFQGNEILSLVVMPGDEVAASLQ